VRPTFAAVVALLAMLPFVARDSAADTPPKTRVSVTVVGKGTMRLVVADGTARPCESSDNHVLFNGHVAAGDDVKLASATGSVCVDHTYGAFRESQWAGASIWSGSGAGWSGVRALDGTLSTDEP
jgi:hypothetical protein